MRSLQQRGRETKKYLFLSSSRLCLMGWGSSSLEILQVCSCADPGSSQLGTPVAKRCCRVFLKVYRVYAFDPVSCQPFQEGGQKMVGTFSDQTESTPHSLQNLVRARLIDPTSSRLKTYTLVRPASSYSMKLSLHQ